MAMIAYHGPSTGGILRRAFLTTPFLYDRELGERRDHLGRPGKVGMHRIHGEIVGQLGYNLPSRLGLAIRLGFMLIEEMGVDIGSGNPDLAERADQEPYSACQTKGFTVSRGTAGTRDEDIVDEEAESQ